MLMIGILKLLPDGKSVPLVPEIGKAAEYYQALTNLFDWCVASNLNPLVADRIPLSEACRTHEFLEGGKYAGKVVLVTGN